MIEVSKKNGYDPSIKDNFFIFRKNTYNLGSFQIILNGNKKTLRYVSETISYRAPLLWANLPDEYKLANSLSKFKSKKKKLGNAIHCLLVMPTFPSEFRFYLNTLVRLTPSKY